MRARPLAAIGLALVFGKTPAGAADKTGPLVRLDFRGPPRCPGSADFLRELVRRQPAVRVASTGESAAALQITIEPAPHGFVGRLVVDVAGKTSERSIRATDCRATTDALALIAALALDGANPITSSVTPASGNPATQGTSLTTAASATQSTDTPAKSIDAPASTPAAASAETHPLPAPNPTAPPVASREAAAPPALPPSPEPTVSPVATTPSSPPDPSADARSRSTGPAGTSLSIRAAGFVAWGTAPGLTAGWTALASVAFADSSALGPVIVGGGIEGVPSESFGGAGGSTSFGMLAGVAEICPISPRPFSGGRLIPCLVGEYGVTNTMGANGSPSLSRPWASAGVEARFSVHVAGPISFEGSVTGVVPIERDHFNFGAESVYQTPFIVARAAAGLSILAP